MQVMHTILYTSAALVLLTGVGNWACRCLFLWTGLKASPAVAATSTHPAAGWIIGWLERSILAIGLVTHSWEVLAAVIALKTVARFKELDDQRFAEYFLVGSLFSILWAILVTSAWLGYDNRFGNDLSTTISGMIDLPEAPDTVKDSE